MPTERIDFAALKIGITRYDDQAGGSRLVTELTSPKRVKQVNAALDAAERMQTALDEVVATWKALQEYTGDEVFKPIEAFRAAIGKLADASDGWIGGRKAP